MYIQNLILKNVLINRLTQIINHYQFIVDNLEREIKQTKNTELYLLLNFYSIQLKNTKKYLNKILK